LDRQRADALVRYDALRKATEQRAIGRQNLLFPDRLELGSLETDLLEAHRALLSELGFDWSRLGERSYVVRSVPALLADARAASSLESLLLALASKPADPRDVALRSLANAGAIENGQPLDDARARGIVAGIWPDEARHRACILGRVPLPAPDDESNAD
jgi:DNA mismatch repair ATPase MutL